MEYVCSSCFEEEGICKFIECNSESEVCDFCGNEDEQPIAAEVDDVGNHLRRCVEKEYENAADHLNYESAEGGYQGLHWDSYDLIQDELEIGLPNDDSGDLIRRLVDSLDDIVWCESRPFSLSTSDLARLSWDEFCRVVKHERRFFFFGHGHPEGELLTPATVLKRIVNYAKLQDLFIELDPAVPLYRARRHCAGSPWTEPEDLGPPPHEKAKQSRMSPAGVPMLYLSDEPETALAEIRAHPTDVSVGRFQLTRSALVLDLSSLPPIPSLFAYSPDEIEINAREILMFLHAVRDTISKRICQDDSVHIEYVPTQIVTEYLRRLPPIDGQAVEGIKYPSSVVQGHWSVVLFANRRNVLGIKNEGRFEERSERWIRLLSMSSYEIARLRVLKSAVAGRAENPLHTVT